MRDAPVSPIAIVGNGLAGRMMALTLARCGLSCTLIGPAPVPDRRTTAIMADGIAFLREIGLWDAAALQAVPLRTMRLISDSESIAFDAAEIGLPEFGFNIANRALHDALSRQLQANAHVTSIAAPVVRLDFDMADARITCEDGTTVTASLVIGADGRNSIVRQEAGIAVTPTQLDQQALVCVVTGEEPHDFTSTEWYHRGGPFTLVPLPDDAQSTHCMAVVYCDTAETIAHLQTLPLAELGDYFTEFSAGRFGALRVTETPQLWPIAPQRSAGLTAPRVALIGEAAHVLPPLAAQGFNISLRDIAALRDAIRHAVELGLDPGQLLVLRDYAAARATDMRLRGAAVDLLNRFIRQDDRIGRMAHAFGFKTLAKLPPLKRFVMRHALTSGTIAA